MRIFFSSFVEVEKKVWVTQRSVNVSLRPVFVRSKKAIPARDRIQMPKQISKTLHLKKISLRVEW